MVNHSTDDQPHTLGSSRIRTHITTDIRFGAFLINVGIKGDLVRLDRVAGDGLLTNAWDSATCLRNKASGSVQSQVRNYELFRTMMFSSGRNK